MGERSDQGFELIMREGVHPTRVVGKKVPPPPEYTETRENGLRIERNVSVRMRDGINIFIDIYRPESKATGPVPVLLGWSPYGKHNTQARLPWPAAGVAEGWISPYTAFEAPDPAYWCPRGYAVVYPDPRGSWYSEGELRHGGQGESQDCYDLIEWLGECPWANGRVGMTGVSYLAAIQWQVAPLRPPHLAALNPWEGFSDWYREFALHGGIPETAFLPRGCGNLQWSTTRTEDTPANVRAHPLHDAYWISKECDLKAINIPTFVVASWSDQGLHTRGTLEGYKRISSPQKWLEVHGRKKWGYYYDPASVEKQRQFFECFLRDRAPVVPAWPRGPGDVGDRATAVSAWPKVRIEVRDRANAGTFRAETEWPLARTEFRKLFLDAAARTLGDQPPVAVSQTQYDSTTGQAAFDYTFDRETELTGHMKLRLWVETVGANDMDLFVAVQKIDRDGSEVPFVFYAMLENGPLALGWLRVSHRELDETRSRPEQPFHPHTRELLLSSGERVPAEIEIWPSSTRFEAGQRLRLLIQGRDTQAQGLPNAPFLRHESLRNEGLHVIHSGGEYDSHLLIPVIPART